MHDNKLQKFWLIQIICLTYTDNIKTMPLKNIKLFKYHLN